MPHILLTLLCMETQTISRISRFPNWTDFVFITWLQTGSDIYRWNNVRVRCVKLYQMMKSACYLASWLASLLAGWLAGWLVEGFSQDTVCSRCSFLRLVCPPPTHNANSRNFHWCESVHGYTPRSPATSSDACECSVYIWRSSLRSYSKTRAPQLTDHWRL